LSEEFVNSLANCSNEPRLQRWKDALALLEADPGFRDLDLANLMNINASDRLRDAFELFQSLSSGHKIVLFTVTRLVELVDERTLVLFVEPESHLHPPLLASLVRVLSMLLIRRNGAAILNCDLSGSRQPRSAREPICGCRGVVSSSVAKMAPLPIPL
jgi:predicted ATP-dependent endonuclease of OLD family